MRILNLLFAQPGSQIDFSFRNDSDYESQMFVKY